MKLLVAIDLTPLSERIADEAAKIAKMTGASVALLHACKPITLPDVTGPQPPEDASYRQEQLDAMADRLRKGGATVDTRFVLSDAPPFQVVVDEAMRQRADLIVVGSHTRSKAYELFIGSCTQGVIREATVPVVVVNGMRSIGGPG